jgi:hypothetical protein
VLEVQAVQVTPQLKLAVAVAAPEDIRVTAALAEQSQQVHRAQVMLLVLVVVALEEAHPALLAVPDIGLVLVAVAA